MSDTEYPRCMTTLAETDLHAVAFFLADHAVVEGGKVYVNGGFWGRLQFPSYPTVASFAVVAVLHVPWRAYHQVHKFMIWFEDADGNRTPAQFEGEFQVGAGPDMRRGDPTTMPVAGLVQNFVIDRPGDYACVLEVDGAKIDRWPFRAVQIFMPTMMPPGPVGPTNIPQPPQA